MKWYWAAALNFASGLAAVLGAILAYETEIYAYMCISLSIYKTLLLLLLLLFTYIHYTHT